MLEALSVPLPPPTAWERYTAAAARKGYPPKLFLAAALADPLVRVQRLGKRQLPYLASNDADALADRLAAGGAR